MFSVPALAVPLDGELFELVFGDHKETSALCPCRFPTEIALEQFFGHIPRVIA